MKNFFLKSVYINFTNYPYIKYIHYFFQYIGNYISLEKEKFLKLLEVSNA